MVNCIILNDADRKYVQSVDPENPADADAQTGDLYETYGATKGYLADSQLRPVRRAGGSGNPDPCFIVNANVLTAVDDVSGNLIFGTAQAYLSGLPIKDSGDPTFPAIYTP